VRPPDNQLPMMSVNYANHERQEVAGVPVSRTLKIASVVPILLAASAVVSALSALRGEFSPPSTTASACPAWSGSQPSTPQAAVIGIATLSPCQVLAAGNVLGADNFNTLAVRFDGTRWAQERTAAPGNSSSLNSVTLTSEANGWAAGTYANGHVTHALVEHWNGTSWVRQPIPEPGGAGRSTSLYGVAAISASQAWVVGNYRSPDGHLRTLIAAWNGAAWRQVASPNPGGARRDDRLTSVTSISASDVWAVGYYQDATSARRVLVLHWDGTSWRQVPAPSPGKSRGAMLFGVTAISASDVWAVGYLIRPGPSILVLHWDGQSWTRSVTPGPGSSGDVLSGVAGSSPSNVWAVGHSQRRSGQTAGLILHWNGATWTLLPSPAPDPGDSARLIGVTTSSAGNAWAVGTYSTPNGYAQGLFLHWNGRNWRP
jgi:hypothetical protein